MPKATILSVEQTEKAGLFTIIFEGEAISEFDSFYTKFLNDAERSNDLYQILNQIDLMMTERGFTERNFRYEGKASDNVVALPVYKNSLPKALYLSYSNALKYNSIAFFIFSLSIILVLTSIDIE